jgi:Fe-S-cluster formation regulator IscX/YfhJ
MRQQDTPVHQLPSFGRYLNKVFDFRSAAAALTDSRRDPEISPATVFLAAFHAFVFRLPSFQQLEAELAQPALQRWIGASRAFSDDALRYSLSGFHLEGLERMLTDINRTLKRNKVFDADRVQGRIVAALDGIEVLSSYSRHCDSCLERRVTVRKAGVKVEQLQYYHRAVGCQIINGPVKTFLALEWLQPGEGEDTAALRLLRNLPERYGSRFFDILLLDALYAQAPVFQLAAELGWDLVVSLKQNLPELYQSAVRLFARRPADCSLTEQRSGKSYQVQLWDTEGLPFSADYPRPVRVVRSEESLTQNHYRRGELTPETTEHEWLWITTLDSQAFPASVVRRLGHDRWKQENNGWNDLTQNWAFKHGFLHACRHRPTADSLNIEGKPVPVVSDGELFPRDTSAASFVVNRGLAAVSLVLLLAFTLSSAFIHCHSKLFRRYRMSTVEVANQLRRAVAKLPPNIRAPDSPAEPQTA